MNLNQYESDRKQQYDQVARDRGDALDTDVAAHVMSFESRIWHRDLIETAAAVVVIVFLGSFLCVVPCPTIMQVGMGITALGALGVVAVVHWTRYLDKVPKHDMPTLDFCTIEIRRVDRQIWLLRNVNWWYSGPPLVGCCIMIYGLLSAIPNLPTAVYYALLAVFYIIFFAAGFIVYRINAKAIESDLVPIRNELADLAKSFEGATSRV